MLRFANPEYLYLLLVIPVLMIIWTVQTRRKRKEQQSFSEELSALEEGME